MTHARSNRFLDGPQMRLNARAAPALLLGLNSPLHGLCTPKELGSAKRSGPR